MTFAIIKDAPPPPKDNGFGRPRKYPVLEMEVGDAFDVPNDAPPSNLFKHPVLQRVTAAAYNATKESHGVRKFIIRLIDQERTVRCWRVK